MTKFMLGTANFGNEYKGLAVPYDQCLEIMDKAWELGIRTVDTARSYGQSESIIRDWCVSRGRAFKVYTKGRSEDDFKESFDVLGKYLFAMLWHSYTETDEITVNIDGVSCYGMEWFDLMHQTEMSIVQVPWNIIDRRHYITASRGRDYGIVSICRSIFIRGEAFKMPDLCGIPFWKWCLQDIPDFDYVIVGVDNTKQLEEIMTTPRHIMPIYTDEGVRT